ncbi:MAG TPA: hypothetical protein VHS28_08335, partial [Chloroflexota bacterium]|nr:hypothetical protein [Chloroflexota bacterium]
RQKHVEAPAPEVSSKVFGDLPPATGAANIIVSSFNSFRALGAFQNALERLEGVRSIRVRRFHRGILYAVVHYEGIVPLEQRLTELCQFAPRIASTRPGTIELHVEAREKPTPR